MTINMECSKCGASIRISSRDEGKTTSCPKCLASIEVSSSPEGEIIDHIANDRTVEKAKRSLKWPINFIQLAVAIDLVVMTCIVLWASMVGRAQTQTNAFSAALVAMMMLSYIAPWNVIALYATLKATKLQNYTLAIFGCFLAFIPMGSCSIFTRGLRIFGGIVTLIILLAAPKVKEGFRIVAEQSFHQKNNSGHS